MIQFDNPQAFFLLAAIPVLYILRAKHIFTRISFPLTISDWNGTTFSFKEPISRCAAVFSELLAIAGFVAAVCALANPVIHHQKKWYTSRGTDILFVLDTSPSMAAKDISVLGERLTRLDAAKTGIKTLVNNENGACYGLVAMASEAAAVVPPTFDLDFFIKQLDSLVIGEFGEGSAIGTGLCSAVYHLSASTAPKKCIILITDGENNAGSVHPETAAELAAENGITIYSFGIGTKGSVPIEYIDPHNGTVHSGYYESDFSTAPLEKIAELTGGSYFGIESTLRLSESLHEIAKKESTVQTFQYRSVDSYCYRTVLAVSAVLFALAWIIRRILLSEVI